MKNIMVTQQTWKLLNARRKQLGYKNHNLVIAEILTNTSKPDVVTLTCPSCEHSFSIDKKCNKIKCPKCNFEGGVE
jgi:predicted Zn-ribbon and HTH transcriptional regulator